VSNIKVIVFDCFGVIVPDLGKELITKSKLSQEAKNEIARLKLEADRGLITEKQLSRQYSVATGRVFSTKARILVHQKHLNKNILKLISALKKNYRVAMLSNINKEYMDLLSKRCNLDKYFELILASSETGYVKPEPQIFKALSDKLTLSYSEMVFIDDQPSNIETARKLGITAFLYQDVKQLQTDLKNVGAI
jgi:HAD superfamily hydrolase (TIGR01509 family)